MLFIYNDYIGIIGYWLNLILLRPFLRHAKVNWTDKETDAVLPIDVSLSSASTLEVNGSQKR